MKRFGLALFLLFGAVGNAQPQQSRTIYFAPDAPRTITMVKGQIVTTVLVPQGALLALEYVADRASGPDTSGRVEVRGHVVVRVAANDMKAVNEPAGSLAERLAQAPVVLTGDGVNLVVTRH